MTEISSWYCAVSGAIWNKKEFETEVLETRIPMGSSDSHWLSSCDTHSKPLRALSENVFIDSVTKSRHQKTRQFIVGLWKKTGALC